MGKQRNPNGMGSFKKRKSDGRHEWHRTINKTNQYLSAKTSALLLEKVKEVVDLPIIKDKLTVDNWFEKWLSTYIKPLKKEATYNQYNDIYRTHISPAIGNRFMREIESIDIQCVIAKMAKYKKSIRKKNPETGKVEMIATNEGLSSWTMKHARKVMNGAFSKALKDKAIAVNPVVDIEIPVKQKKPAKTLTTNELSKLFKAMQYSRWVWSVKFALVTGVRRGELLALKWSDIDRKNKRITIDKSNSLTGMGDTKNAKIHYIPLSEKAIEYLDEQKNMLEREFNTNTEVIFPSDEGKMMPPNSYYTMLSRFAQNAGFKASPHCLRHTFVYFTKGVLSLEEIQAILGHSSKTQTLELYGNMIKDTVKETAVQIDSVFGDFEKKMKETEKEERIKSAKESAKKEGNLIDIKFGKAK